MGKKYDVVATTGTYEKDGQKKFINKNVGAIIETQHGPRLVLDASFNPAGCHRTEDGKVYLALFEPRQDGQGGGYAQQSGGQQPPESDVPF